MAEIRGTSFKKSRARQSSTTPQTLVGVDHFMVLIISQLKPHGPASAADPVVGKTSMGQPVEEPTMGNSLQVCLLDSVQSVVSAVSCVSCLFCVTCLAMFVQPLAATPKEPGPADEELNMIKTYITQLLGNSPEALCWL